MSETPLSAPTSGESSDRAAALRSAERIARLAAVALRAPMASLAAAEGAGLYVRSCVGFPKDGTPRPGSPFLCPLSRHVFSSGAPLSIADVPSHPLGAGHAGLAALGVRAYLGHPLRSAAGATLGMLSVFSREEREWSEEDESALRDLAELASEDSELRLALAGASPRVTGGGAEGVEATEGEGAPAGVGRPTTVDAVATRRKMEALGRLAGGMAHDFNNHLTAIAGFAQIASRAMGGSAAEGSGGAAPIPAESLDRLRRDVEEISAAAARASSLTGQLLAVGGRLPSRPVTFDLNERVASFEAIVRGLVPEGVEIELVLHPAPAFVRVDPSHVEQLLRQLVLNAGDAMSDGGRLTIETSVSLARDGAGAPSSAATAGNVVLTVRDSGVGIDDETRAHLFEPYFTTKDVGKGAGLGLATVHGIVRQARGDVVVESAPGRGTTVHVLFPAAEPPRNGSGSGQVGAGIGEPGLPATGARREATVLVVEDEPAVRQLACTMLRRLGHRVVPAADSAEALRLLAALADDGIVPDLLVTDVVMPGMGGPALAEEIARRHTRVAVLYMSGYSDDMVERGGELGAGTAFLEKPFSLEQFSARVAELLRQTN